jgi:ankyrin repeat protein
MYRDKMHFTMLISLITEMRHSEAVDLLNGMLPYCIRDRWTVKPAAILDKVRYLVEQGCDINCSNKNRETVSYEAMNKEVLHRLLHMGVRPDLMKANRNASIHFAVQKERTYMLKALLAHEKGKETLNLRNSDGLTAYHLALFSKEERLWEILATAGADKTIPLSQGDWRDALEKLRRDEKGARSIEWAEAVKAVLGR